MQKYLEQKQKEIVHKVGINDDAIEKQQNYLITAQSIEKKNSIQNKIKELNKNYKALFNEYNYYTGMRRLKDEEIKNKIKLEKPHITKPWKNQ